MRRVKTSFALACAGVLVLTGCDDLSQRQQTGVAAGAMLGGLIGATRPNSNLGTTAVGAAAGAMIGGAIGSLLDKQAGELRSSLGNSDIKVVNTGNELIVVMPNDILFPTDSAVVNGGLRSDLGVLARNLQEYPNSTIEVVGHTDNVGEASYNLSLSRRRAASVAAVMIDQGVPSWRIVTIGRGEDRPVASNLTPEGRQQNRRVEIIIRPTSS